MDYLYALQNLRDSAPQFFNYFFVFVSEYLLKIFFIVPAVIYWVVDKENGCTILFGYGLGTEINQIVKNFACIYRPWILDSRLHLEPLAAKSATGYSFPSGHTASAASTYGGISIWQKKRKSVVIIMSFLILLTAFARNFLGAHTLRDVICAILISAAALCIVQVLRYFLAKNQKLDTLIAFAGILLCVIFLLVAVFKPYPRDYSSDGNLLVDPYAMLTDCFTQCGILCGLLFGWWLERRFVKFTLSENRKVRIIRSAAGVLCMVIFYFTFTGLFSFAGIHLAHFIKYFLIYFFVIFIYPLIFSKIESRFFHV